MSNWHFSLLVGGCACLYFCRSQVNSLKSVCGIGNFYQCPRCPPYEHGFKSRHGGNIVVQNKDCKIFPSNIDVCQLVQDISTNFSSIDDLSLCVMNSKVDISNLSTCVGKNKVDISNISTCVIQNKVDISNIRQKVVKMTVSGEIVVPESVCFVKIMAIGGGGGGGNGSPFISGPTGGGGGGGSGFIEEVSFIVSSGTVFFADIGIGGEPQEQGGNTTVTLDGKIIVDVSGGQAGETSNSQGGGNGGDGYYGGGGGARGTNFGEGIGGTGLITCYDGDSASTNMKGGNGGPKSIGGTGGTSNMNGGAGGGGGGLTGGSGGTDGPGLGNGTDGTLGGGGGGGKGKSPSGFTASKGGKGGDGFVQFIFY